MGLIVATVAALFLVMLATVLVQAALSGIYSAALYRFATTNEGTAGFSAETLQLAFRPK